MLKPKRIAAAIFAIIIGMIMLAGCGNNLSGKYNGIEIIEYGEITQIAELVKNWKEFYDEMKSFYEETDMEMDEEFGEFDDSYYAFYLEFSGGDVTVCIFGTPEKGTYKINGEEIEIIIDGESLKGTIDKNKITLILEDEEYSIVFVK